MKSLFNTLDKRYGRSYTIDASNLGSTLLDDPSFYDPLYKTFMSLRWMLEGLMDNHHGLTA